MRQRIIERMKFSDRLRQASGGIPINELARRSHVPQPTISRILNGTDPQLSTVEKLARGLNVSLGVLFADEPATVTANDQLKRLPLIPIHVADEWLRGTANVAPAGVVYSQTDAGRDGFATAQVGDSMDDGTPFGFPEGTILVVNPGLAFDCGPYVLARDGKTGAPTFKRLARDAGRWFLLPMNRQFAPIEVDAPEAVVIGVVVEAQFVRRLARSNSPTRGAT